MFKYFIFFYVFLFPSLRMSTWLIGLLGVPSVYANQSHARR